MNKYYIVKAFATEAEIEEGTAYAEAAGYQIDLGGDSGNFTIDTEMFTIFMNGTEGERLFSLVAFKNIIDENPVTFLDSELDFDDFEADDEINELIELDGLEDPSDFDTVISGGSTFIEDGDFSVVTSLKNVKIGKSESFLNIELS